MSQDVPNRPPTEFSEEGTAAHELVEWCLVNNRHAESYRGQTITTDAGFEFFVNDDMIAAVQTYLDEVVKLFTSKPGAVLGVETRFSLEWLHPGCFGTNDTSVTFKGDELIIMDYKHGKGIAVEVTDNPQLMYYALGALGPDNKENVKKITMVIGQPRAYHKDGPMRYWSITVEQLYAWCYDVLLPGILETEKPNAKLEAGEHCRFCPAKPTCGKIASVAFEVAKVDFAHIKPNQPIELNLPDIRRIPDDKVTQLMEFASIFKGWIGSLEEYVQGKMVGGGQIEGMKLVHGKSHRKVADMNQVEKIFTENGLSVEDTVNVPPPKAKTPNQLELALKAHGVDRKLIKDCISVSKPLKAVPETAKGEAVLPEGQAMAMFAGIVPQPQPTSGV